MSKIVGTRLKELRESLGFKNQTIFAEKLDITQTSLSKYEIGTVDIPDEVKAKIGELGINLNWLLLGIGEKFLSASNGEKHPVISSLEIFIDQRLEKIESRLEEVENCIQKRNTDTPDFALYTNDPEPEYGAVEIVTIPFVQSIAGGPPTPQSDNVWDYIEVPKKLIKTSKEDYYTARVEGESMAEAGIPDSSMVLIRKSDVPKHNAIQVVRRGGTSTLKRLREHEDHRWTLHFEDGTGRLIELGPDEDYQVQGDFVAVLPEVK
jgi:SOS-response transcriptional repressor LexA